MKYLVQTTPRNKTLTYQRHWPADLRQRSKDLGLGARFTMPTGVRVDGDLVEQAVAKAEGDKAFGTEVAMLRGMGEGDARMMRASFETLKADKATSQRFLLGGRLSKRLAAPDTKIPTLFGLLTQWHHSHPNTTAKAFKYRQTYWDQWCQCVGSDELARRESVDVIHTGLDKWQAQMLDRGCTAATVSRARGAVVSVLRWAATEWRLGWSISLKRLPAARPTPKAVLSVAEQRRLLALVAEERSVTGAMSALMLAGGLMPSEVGRLDPAVVVESLSADIPYVVIGHGSEVKAEARRRIVPVVWPAGVVDVLIEQLPEAIERAAAAADSSATVNKWLRTRGFNVTGHGLRHTLAAAAGAAMANPLALARIGGWSGSGLNPIMLGYGAGVEDSQLLNELAAEARRWFAAVIAD